MFPMLRFGLKETTIAEICGVLAKYPAVEKATLYGSRAKGNYKNGSDIDLTLHGGDDLTLHVLFRIMDDIDDLLQPYTMDISIYANIGDPDVVEQIQRIGVTFYEKEEAVVEIG